MVVRAECVYVCVNLGHCVALRALGKGVVSQIMPDESGAPTCQMNPVSHCLFPIPSLMLRHNDCPLLPLLPPVPMTEGSGGVRPGALFNRPHWLDIMPNGRGHHSDHRIMSDGRDNHTRSCGVTHLSRVTTRHDHTGHSLTVVMPKLRKGTFFSPQMRPLTRLPLPRDGSSGPGPFGPCRRGAPHCPGSAGQTSRPRGPELAAEPHPWDTAPGAQSRQGTLTAVHRGHQAHVLVCLSLSLFLSHSLFALSSLLLSAPVLSVLQKTPKSCFWPSIPFTQSAAPA